MNCISLRPTLMRTRAAREPIASAEVRLQLRSHCTVLDMIQVVQTPALRRTTEAWQSDSHVPRLLASIRTVGCVRVQHARIG